MNPSLFVDKLIIDRKRQSKQLYSLQSINIIHVHVILLYRYIVNVYLSKPSKMNVNFLKGDGFKTIKTTKFKIVKLYNKKVIA